MWDKVKSLIGNAAPLIGSLLGGRYGEKVGSLIAGALGVEDKPEAIESALRAHPELLLELQKLEHEHRTQLTQLQMAELTEAANSEARRIADIQHAREEHKDHPMVSVVTLVFLAITSYLVWVVVGTVIPPENRDLAVFIFGQIIGFTGAAVNFWLGANPKNSIFRIGKP
ncbi:TPA: hypothetical protein QD004_000052 [Shewanella algae]|uniref:hypothetical protein n=1 Tax=Shewanella algae TaxID=38313 RepID=UPI001C57EF77|nr:hypothetical protein [Shewanella algae]HDS1200805.1 hypothetical protein [Shewanella algae]HEW9976069.1 hypothetical protein [Shewanella algae]